MFRTWATGNEKNTAETSYCIMHSPGLSVMSLLCSTKCFVLFMVLLSVHKGIEDACYNLSYSIGNCVPARYYRP